MEIGDAVKRAEAAFDDADKEHSGSLDCKKLHSVVQSLLANGNLRHELFGQYSVYQEFANSILMSPAASKVSKDKFISWVESRLAAAGVDCCGSGTSTHPDLTSLIAQNQLLQLQNAHMLNLLTESAVNVEKLSAAVRQVRTGEIRAKLRRVIFLNECLSDLSLAFEF
mmetsp:Transcript_41643/g.111651  ORF Transcript_41643/g.111651 Transcript_41643/m.111651 type:complete len:168 (-) Transcript_41643:250-753(-)